MRRAVRHRPSPSMAVGLLALALAAAGCGGSGHSGSASSGISGNSAVPLTLEQVKGNLQKAGYRITVYTPNEGVLQIDATHTAAAGLSVDDSPDGQRLYAAVFQTGDPAVRAAVISRNSDETKPFVRGDLIFTISGTAPELQRIVKDSGDAPPSTVPPAPHSDASVAQVKASAQRFINLFATGDEKSLCASFTPQALTKSKTFCDPRSIFYHRKPDPRVKQYSITAVTANGDTATATITFETTTEQIALRKLAGQWKIDTQLAAGHLF